MKLCTACLVEGVTRAADHAPKLGYCRKHYKRFWKHGDPFRVKPRIMPHGGRNNHRIVFTPKLWAKWLSREHPHAAHLREGIDRFRRELAEREFVSH